MKKENNFCSGSADKVIKICSLADFSVKGELIDHRNWVFDLEYIDHHLISASSDKSIKVNLPINF